MGVEPRANIMIPHHNNIMPISILTHKIILYSCLSVSLVGNSLLILLVMHSQSAVMGRYRWLLVIFGITDMTTSILHSFLIPISTGAPYGLALFSHTALYWNEKASLLMNLLLVVLFMEPFVLLAFHFIYRFLALWTPSMLHQHSGKFAITLISLNCLSVGLTVNSFSDIWTASKSATFFVDQFRNEYGMNFLISPRPNIFSINFKKYRDPRSLWNWPVMKSMAMVTIPATLSVFICFICTYFILKGFSTKTLKVRFRLLQIQLFHALLFQFAVPMVLVCLPFTLGIGLPLLGLDMGQLANICGLVFELYPAIDPFVIILAVPRFKRIVLEKIRLIRIERFRHNELREQSRVRHYFSLLMGREPMSGGDTHQAAGRVIPIAFLSSRAVCT